MRCSLSALMLFVAAASAQDFFAVEKLLAAGQYRQALAALEGIPSSTARWRLLASKAFDGLNEPARAVSEAEAGLELDPQNESLYLQLGQIFLARNTPQPAYEIFSDAQRFFPDSLLVRLGKGLALKDLQRYEEAEQELLECRRRKPDFGLAFDALATVYIQTKRYRDAARASEQFLRDNPADFRGYYYLAAGQDGLKADPAGAEKLLRRAIQLKPDFAASHALLGKILLEADRASEAVLPLEEAVRLRPDYSPAHYHLATAYRKLGRREDAAREFQIVSDLKDRERQPAPALLYHRGKK